MWYLCKYGTIRQTTKLCLIIISMLSIFTIYKSPLDYPGKYVARRFLLDKPTNDRYIDENLDTVRQWVKYKIELSGTSPYRIERNVSDEPHILESWV